MSFNNDEYDFVNVPDIFLALLSRHCWQELGSAIYKLVNFTQKSILTREILTQILTYFNARKQNSNDMSLRV